MKQGLVAFLLPLGILLGMVGLSVLLSFGFLRLAGDIFPLAKTISKLTLILLLLSIFPLRNYLSLSWQTLGFAKPKFFFRQLGMGLLLGLLSLLPVLISLVWLDVHVWDQGRVWTIAKVFEKTGLALFFALLIGLGEEILFRGLLLSSLRLRLSVLNSIVISSAYFAALHFLKSKSQIPYAQQTWTTGFKLMSEAFTNWLNPEILSAFIALFIVGAFLAVMRSRVPQSLGLCIGCHAGWVWMIKCSKDFFNFNPEADFSYLVSGYDGVVGPLVSVWLGLGIMVWSYFGSRKAIKRF